MIFRIFRKWFYACKRKEGKSKKMVVDAPALASLVGGRAQKVMESESKRPKICNKQTTKYQERENAKARKTRPIIVFLAVVEEKLNCQISSLAATKIVYWLLEYLDPKENAYFESQSLLGPYPKVLHRRLLFLFKLLHYRSMDKKLVLVFKKGWLWNLLLNCPLGSKN